MDYKSVPVAPTEEMIDAGLSTLDDDFKSWDKAEVVAFYAAMLDAAPDNGEPRELLASRLIDAWCADKGKQIPWAKAVQIVAIVTQQPDAERDRLLYMGDEDGSCEMCGRSAAAPQPAPELMPWTQKLVSDFSGALAEKLAAAETKYGYSDGWREPGWMDECRAKLREHVDKGDPRDVAAYCAFLWYHKERTCDETKPAPDAPKDGLVERLRDGAMVYGHWARPAIAAMLNEAAAALQSQAEQIAANDPAELWSQIYTLRHEMKGPDGFATWKDAAIDERIKRAEQAEQIAALRECVGVRDASLAVQSRELTAREAEIAAQAEQIAALTPNDGARFSTMSPNRLWAEAVKLEHELNKARVEIAALREAEKRYEYVRRLNARQFAELFQQCLTGPHFDDVVDARIAALAAKGGA